MYMRKNWYTCDFDFIFLICVFWLFLEMLNYLNCVFSISLSSLNLTGIPVISKMSQLASMYKWKYSYSLIKG